MKTTKPKTKAPKMKAAKEPSQEQQQIKMHWEKITEMESKINRAWTLIARHEDRLNIMETKSSWRKFIDKLKGNG